jgi:ferredoxin-NADP reductase/uncharacterized protein YcbX
MVVDSRGFVISARECSGLYQLSAQILGDVLRLRFKGEYFSCDFSDLIARDYATERQVDIWERKYQAIDLGDPLADWLNKQLRYDADNLRLVYLPQEPASPLNTDDHFGDVAPVLLLSGASLKLLNERLPVAIDVSHFRPNFVVDGVLPHAEDNWHRLRIGELELESMGGCPRCMMTTLKPGSGLRDLSAEPMKTLAAYRQLQDGNILFGQYYKISKPGLVTRGDRLEILETQSAPVFKCSDPTNTESFRGASQSEKVNELERIDHGVFRCRSIINDGNDIKRFVFASDELAQLNYLPGQFAVFCQKLNGLPTKRCYSLVSTPALQDSIEIAVKRLPGGHFSQWLHSDFEVGDTLLVEAVGGDYTLSDSTAPLLLMAAGSGITPNIALLRHLDAEQPERDVCFIYTARCWNDLAFMAEIKLCQEVMPRLRLIINLTADDYAGKRHSGRLNQPDLLNWVPDIRQRDVFYCGPEPYNAAVKKLLEDMGVDQSQVCTEAFVADGPALMPAVAIKEFQLQHRASGQTIAASNQQPLLQSLLEADVEIPYACQMGACGSCSVEIIEGSVETRVFGKAQIVQADSNSPGSTMVLCCCSYPQTDVILA